ncbi:MAG: AAA family ATPase [Candidatus Saccharimonadales bacterium]
MRRLKIIGIGGLARSGKDTLAELLVESGYFGVSLGDIVRDAARKRHANKPDPISVANMTETANWMRQTKGADFALVEALEQFKKVNHTADYRGLLVYSVRAPAEADFILNHGGELIWVDAKDQIRYKRDMESRRQGEAEVSFHEFKRQEDLQWQPQPGIPPEAQMNVEYVKSKATKLLENDGNDLEAFKNTASKVLASYLN